MSAGGYNLQDTHFRSRAEGEATLLLSEIEMLQAQGTRARSIRVQTLQERADKLMRAPIYHLSDELLRMIFTLDAAQSEDTEGPERAAKVVSLWRDVALNTPELWVPIRVRINGKSTLRQIERLEELVKRASVGDPRRPLRLTVTCEELPQSDGVCDRLFNHLVRLLERCISFECSQSDPEDVWTLELNCQNSTGRAAAGAIPTISQLERLVLINSRLHSADDWLSYLAVSATSLQELSLISPQIFHEPFIPNEAINLPSIRKLVGEGRSLAEELLPLVYLPALRSLGLVADCSGLLQWVDGTVVRSRPHLNVPLLRELFFTDASHLEWSVLDRLLSYLPQLENLIFTGMAFGEFEDGEPVGGPLAFVPPIRHTFDSCSDFAEFFQQMYGDAEVSLGTIDLRASRPWSEDIKAAIQAISRSPVTWIIAEDMLNADPTDE